MPLSWNTEQSITADQNTNCVEQEREGEVYTTPTLPDTNELLVEDHPGQKVDKGGVGGEDGGDHRAVQVLQGGDVKIIGEDWHQTEEETPW